MHGARLWARRSCLAAAAACLVLALATPGTGAQEAEGDDVPRPAVWRGSASSLAISIEADREALLPVPEVFRFIALDGNGTYESSTQQARASILFPGNGLILGPGLVCGTFGKEFPEEFKPVLDACVQYKYPLTVFADSFEPDGSTTGALAMGSEEDSISGTAGGAKAHAGEDGVTTDAAMQDLRVLGLPPFGPVKPPIEGFELDTSVLTVDSATSRTAQHIVRGGLVADAEATISGIRMIGGLLRIGSIKSESHVTDDGAGKQTTARVFEVSGVTVAGVPAQITDKGLVVGEPGGGDGPLADQAQSQANQLLKEFDIRVTVLPSEEGKEEGAAFARVGGLLIEFERDLQGAPILPGPIGDIDPNGLYRGTIQLGNTAAVGSVPVIPDDPLIEDAPIDPPVDAGGLEPGSAADDLGTGGSPDGDAPADSAGGSAADPGGGEEVAAAPQGRPVGFVDDLFADRMRWLYLAFTLAALGLCLAPRLTLPARLPENRL